MRDIFLSYAREDEARVRPIVEELQARGWSVFWDRTTPPEMEENSGAGAPRSRRGEA